MRKGNAVGDEIHIATYNSKNRTVSDEHLSEIFSAVGARYGYGDIRAEFAALKDFRVRWQRSYNWAVFTVSDYLDRAPDAVLENLAEVLFSKINSAGAMVSAILRFRTSMRLTVFLF
jgi:archaellum biogenesis protein FlaJ (TadC family)